MKMLFAIICMLAAGASTLRAQQAGDFGAGVILGNPTGATAKLWLTDSQALDAGLGFSTGLALYGDYLWHSWKVLPQPSQGKLPVYLGLGAQFTGFARVQYPVVELPDAGLVVLLPGADGVGQHRQLAARQAQLQLVGQPRGDFGFIAQQALLDRRFQTFRIGEAAHRQGR